VVCGTDTGVGKTIVTAAIAALAMRTGLRVRVLKPVQTGAVADDDAAEVGRLAPGADCRAGVKLRLPLAPAVAARLEGTALDPAELTAWMTDNTADADVVLVETAGGVAVEIAPGFDMGTLPARLGYPALLVCRPGLGTLNHTALSVEHLRHRGAVVAGLVISDLPAVPDLSEATNPAELEALTGAPVLGVLPRLELAPGEFEQGARTALSPELFGDFDRAALMAQMEVRARELLEEPH
jgi:dethiobiotin synthetase